MTDERHDSPLTQQAGADAEKSQLSRSLGVPTGIALVVGAAIGSGIFVKPGVIAHNLGDVRLILLAWSLGGVLALFGGLCFAELAAMLPHSGGLYAYLREAYGPSVGFLFGWNDVLFNRPAATGALSVVFVGSLARAIGWQPGDLAQTLTAAAVIALLAGINIFGAHWGGWMQITTTLVKAGFLGLLILLPVLLIPLGRSTFSLANWSSVVPVETEESLLSRFGMVMLAVMWAYNGWHGVTPAAEEIRRPERAIPISLIAGIGILIVLYVGANLAYHGVMSHDEIAAAGEHTAEVMLSRLLGPIGGVLMAGAIMCSSLGSMNTDLLVTPRISYAMARDGLFLRFLNNVHKRFGTPARSIAIQAVMAILLVAASAVLVEVDIRLSSTSMFELLSNFVVFAASIFYVLGVLAVPVLRWKQPDRARPYRTWGYPIVPLVFLAVYAWFLREVYLSRPVEAHIGLLLIACGIPVYLAFAARSSDRNRCEKSAADTDRSDVVKSQGQSIPPMTGGDPAASYDQRISDTGGDLS